MLRLLAESNEVPTTRNVSFCPYPMQVNSLIGSDVLVKVLPTIEDGSIYIVVLIFIWFVVICLKVDSQGL